VTANTSSEAHHQAQAEAEQAELTAQRPRGFVLAITLGLVAVWIALMSRFGSTDVYSIMGPYACVVAVVCFVLSPRELLAAFACDTKGVLLGLGVGAVMTLLTYPVFSFAVGIMPSLAEQVAGLYSFATTTSLGKALFWVCTLVIAEEVLFRSVLPRVLQLWTAERSAFALATLVYAFAQLGSGSFIIFLLALVCGAIWAALRLYTGSITPGLLAHAIWTPTVIVLFPVT
jgi:membrane protease YdiL (CAAX protease family)